MDCASRGRRSLADEPIVKAVCIAGQIGSGKTMLADAVAASVAGSVRRSFGDTVRRHAEASGRAADRHSLQTVGEHLINHELVDFVAETIGFLSPQTALLVLDGVRHPLALAEIRRQLPRVPVVLVYVQTANEVRQQRAIVRGEDWSSTAHPVESEILDLPLIADLVVGGQDPLAGSVNRVIDLLDLPSDGRRSRA